MEPKFTEQDSFKLINEMIAQARDNVQTNSGKILVFNGYIISLLAIANIVLLHLLPEPVYSFWIWALVYPFTFIYMFLEKKKEKPAIVRTYIDRIVAKTWRAFGISVIVLLASIFLCVFIFESWLFCVLITPVILVLTGLAQYVTGHTCRYTLFIRAAYIFWGGALLSVISYLLMQSQDLPFLILAVCMVIGFVIPGHNLNQKAKQNV